MYGNFVFLRPLGLRLLVSNGTSSGPVVIDTTLLAVKGKSDRSHVVL
ncbi:hypothetical protein AAOGI_45030 [Agarivorans albus]